jgi:peptidoglycan hydrolase-like protein with peptidoglycan-binding domain
MAMIYKVGSPKSEVVKQIQRALNLYPDGMYGPLTRERVMQFQRENHLTPDGIVGPVTLARLLPKVAAEVLNIRKSRRTITDIVVHCTATPFGKDLSVDDIRKMHKKQGWSDIGYHYVVTLDGIAREGRDVDISGAHVSGHNAHSIGVVYVGGLDKNGKAADTRNNAQKAGLLSLLMDLRKLYPKARISGHRDFSPDLNHNGIIEPWERIKECPCFDAKEEYKRI